MRTIRYALMILCLTASPLLTGVAWAADPPRPSAASGSVVQSWPGQFQPTTYRCQDGTVVARDGICPPSPNISGVLPPYVNGAITLAPAAAAQSEPREWRVLILTEGGRATIVDRLTEAEAKAVAKLTEPKACFVLTTAGTCPTDAPGVRRIEAFR